MSPTDPASRRESLRLVPWIALAGIVLFGLAVLALPDYRTPEELLARVRAQLAAPPFDDDRALLDLEAAAKRARAADDDALLAQVLETRAEVLLAMGARVEARSVLEELLESLRAGDLALELRLAELLWEEGEVEEAEERIDRLLERAPTNGRAWSARARILEQRADEELAAAQAALAPGPFAPAGGRIEELVAELAAREARDPERKTALSELRQLTGRRREQDFERGTALAAGASRLRGDARLAYSQSLLLGPDAPAAAGLVASIHRAGRSDLASELGLLARSLSSLRSDSDLALAMLAPLATLGDTQRLQALASGWKWDTWGTSSAFCEQLCRTLYEAGMWSMLATPAAEARRRLGESGTALSLFVSGMASYARSAPDAASSLQTFLALEHPGLSEYDVDAWLALAKLYRERKQPALELEALREAVRLRPTIDDAQLWLRLALLTEQARNAGYADVERYWTRAMELSPETAPAMVDKWFEYAELALPTNRRRFDLLYQETRAAGYALPALEIGPGTRLRFALRFLAEGEVQLALRTAEDLLTEYPDLIPALDLVFDASLRLGRRDRASSIVLRRLILLGRSETVLRQMAEVGAKAFEPDQVIRAMRADPASTGRLVVARAALDADRPRDALLALGVDEPTRQRMFDVEWRVEAARALLAVGRFEHARRALAGAARHPLFGRDARTLEIELAVATEDDAELRRIAARLAAERDPDRPLMMQLARALAERGLFERALELARWLDGRPEMRAGDLLLLLARLELFRADYAAADELLERAEAFELGGQVERTRILLAVAERRWTDLPALAAAYRVARPRMPAALSANLALLAEELATGTTILRDERAGRAGDADWQLLEAAARALVGAEPSLDPLLGGARYAGELGTVLRGAAERVADPRELLALLLVVDDPDWAPWSQAQVERLQPERHGSLWRLYFSARILRARGEEQRADALEDELRREYPHFGPGWELTERRLLARNGGDPWDPALVRLRAARARATAPEGWPRAALDQTLDHAVLLAEEGNPSTARAIVEEAFRGAAEVDRGRQVLARLRASSGDWGASIEAWLRVLPRTDDGVGPGFLEEALDTLRRATRDTERPLRPVEAARALEELARRFPRDPRVALAQARHEAGRTPANPALGIGAALGVLETFRARTGRAALSRLVPGSALAWAEWLAPRSTSKTQELLVREIAADPGAVELWLALARTFEIVGREEEALALYLDVAEMTGSSVAHMGAAHILSSSPARGREVEQHVLAAERAAGGDLGVAALYLRIRARLGRRDAGLDVALDKLSDLWAQREANRHIVEPFELGRTWIQAILQRREGGDLERLERLSRELAAHVRGGIESEWLRACQGLARSVEARSEPAEAGRGAHKAPSEADGKAGDPAPSAGEPGGDAEPDPQSSEPAVRDG